jgi:serine/threonine protein phosphatase PrpC
MRGGARWRTIAASARGTSHEKTAQPCQDAFYWSTLPEGILVAAVADGAGSAAYGDIGAMLATHTAVAMVRRHLYDAPRPATDAAWRVCMTAASQAAQAAVLAEATAHRCQPRHLATTLMLLVATPENVVALQVGDGATVVGDRHGNPISLTVPQNGEYANETTFLTSPEALATAQIRVWHGMPAYLVAFSDGLQRLALGMPDGLPHRPFFAPLFGFLATMTDEQAAQEHLRVFLHSHRVRERTDDDLTLLLATLTR